MNGKHINIIGAGLAGCEAAHMAAKLGVQSTLYEMKPRMRTAAHKTDNFAELVCSNSLRADGIYNAVGLLKEEMRRLGSLIMECADETRVPAGGALAVDREAFSAMVTEKIKANPMIEVVEGEVSKVNTDEITVIAAGPLASEAISAEIEKLTGGEGLHFFDAAAPIVTYESIDMSRAFKAARYGKGGDDYINCPMEKEEYERFWRELTAAECAEVHGVIDDPKVFEGCMPIEVMAKRGSDTMRYGPLKPVGLTNPHSGSRPYAVVQLRQDNKGASLYNIVGFQTHLRFGEQKRVFSMIPGLENAEFVRYGVMHRNTYINSPTVLTGSYNMKENPNVFFAGQITGVEGYVESASSGLWAGVCAAQRALGLEAPGLNAKTAIGALAAYISNGSITNFQPMNVNYGIFEDLGERIKDKREKAERYAERSFAEIESIKNELKI